MGIQLAGYGLAFIAVLEFGYTGRTWKKFSKWIESLSSSPAEILVYLTFPVWISFFLVFMSLGGLGFIFGGSRAAEIQAKKTGQDYLGQNQDWLDHYFDAVYPLLAADTDFVYRGHKSIQQSYLDYRRAIRGKPVTDIASSDEEAHRWHVEDFKQWLEQISS